jgi:hypothetical protein
VKNFLTFGQVESGVLREGKINDSQIGREIRKVYINQALMKVYDLLDALDDPFYNQPVILTIAADQDLRKSANYNGGVIEKITASTKIIQSLTAFVSGQFVSVATWDGSGVLQSFWTGRIVTGGLQAVFEVLSGSAVDFDYSVTGSNAAVAVVRSLSALSANLSALYFKRVNFISDTVGNEFKMVQDPQVFERSAADFFNQSKVLWYHQADVIKFAVGPRSASLGTVTAEIRMKPALYTDATVGSEIEIPPERNMMLQDEVTNLFYRHVGVPVPQDVAGRSAAYAAAFEALQASKDNEAKKKGS